MSSASSGAQCAEVRHWAEGGTCVVRLGQSASGQQTVHHDISGEVVVLPADHMWKLGFQGGWAFVSAFGQESKWVARLFKHSCWRAPCGRIFLRWAEVGPDGMSRPRVRWIDEHQAQHIARYAFWRFTGLHREVPSCKVLHMSVPRGGSRCFWSLAGLQRNADFQSESLASSKWIMRRVKSWSNWLATMGIDGQHIMRPLSSPQASAQGGLELETWFFSTQALLALLSHMACTTVSAEDARSIFAILEGWLRASLADMIVQVSGDQLARAGLAQVEEVRFVIEAGRLYIHDGGKLFPDECSGQGMASVFCDLHRRGKQARSSFVCLVDIMGKAMEDCFQSKSWPEDPTALAAHTGVKRKRADPTLRVVASRAEGGRLRNAFRFADAAKTFGRQGIAYESWVDKVLCKQYLLAACRSCGQGTAFAVSTDSSKVVFGKSWLKTALLNVSSGEAMWCAPQAGGAYFWGVGGGVPKPLIEVPACLLEVSSFPGEVLRGCGFPAEVLRGFFVPRRTS